MAKKLWNEDDQVSDGCARLLEQVPPKADVSGCPSQFVYCRPASPIDRAAYTTWLETFPALINPEQFLEQIERLPIVVERFQVVHRLIKSNPRWWALALLDDWFKKYKDVLLGGVEVEGEP